MSSVVQDELSQLTNEQLRLRLIQNGIANMPVTSTTREVLLKKLRTIINGQQTGSSRRETIHVPNVEARDGKNAKPNNAGNRRNTVSTIATSTKDVAEVPKSKSVRRSGRVTPSVINENGSAGSIVVPPIQEDIIELDDEPAAEVYMQPKRTSRSPSLGKSQTVVTSYKTEVAKQLPIVESTEEDDDIIPINQNRLYPSLGIDNGLNKLYPSTSKDTTSTLRRTTMHTTQYEPIFKPSLRDNNYDGVMSFKAPLPKGRTTTSYSNYENTSGLNRRYTTNTFTSKQLGENYEDESGTEHSDIDTPYLSNFARRLSQLKPEPLDRKILRDVKKQHHLQAGDSLWHSFTMLVIAFGRKFGSILLALIILMLIVFVYVFFII